MNKCSTITSAQTFAFVYELGADTSAYHVEQFFKPLDIHVR